MASKTQSCSKLFQKCKPYAAMIFLQFGYAGMNIITKVSLNHGMSHFVLVVYRHAIATISMAPFALILERNKRPRMTWKIFMQIFILALLGPVIDQNFYYAGLKFTSPTFACAISNMLPVMTFALAVIFRMEKVNLKKVVHQAKVVGTLVTVAGAMLMTLYKGPIIKMAWNSVVNAHHIAATGSTNNSTDKDWVKGCIFVIIATLAWASLFVLQVITRLFRNFSFTKLLQIKMFVNVLAITMKAYDAPISLTTWICFVGTLQAIAVTRVMEHNASVWNIGWDMNLLAAAYAGIITSGIAYYVQGLVMQLRGPVFASAFSPLMMIIVAIMGSFILAEKIYLGGVLGAILIVVGLYSVLWGKYNENKVEDIKIPVTIKGNEGNVMAIEHNIEFNEVKLEKDKCQNMNVQINTNKEELYGFSG